MAGAALITPRRGCAASREHEKLWEARCPADPGRTWNMAPAQQLCHQGPFRIGPERKHLESNENSILLATLEAGPWQQKVLIGDQGSGPI